MTAEEPIKILFADDDEYTRETFLHCFGDRYEIATAGSGREALGLFGDGSAFAVVLSDLKMEEMSGVDLLSKMREINAEPIRIIITGFMDAEDVIEAINRCHISQYIVKPWDNVQLRLILDQAGQRWRLARENLRLNRKLQENNLLLQEANAHLQESESRLRLLSSSLINAQENERRRISMELHDELGQSLAALKLQIRVLENHLAKEMQPDCQHSLHAELQKLRKFINEIIENVRRLSKNLSPVIIDDLGLDAAIEHLILSSARMYGIEYRYSPINLGSIFEDEQNHLVYRMVQEAINNVGKHSHATLMELDMAHITNQVILKISDNGIGFHAEEVLDKAPLERGIGIAAMSERVKMLNGEMDVLSTPGQGTKIIFRIPRGLP